MICVGCTKEFEPRNGNQRRCKADCGRTRTRTSQVAHKARTEQRETHDVDFIGVDGEGQRMPGGTHGYVLLSVGDESLFHDDGSILTAPEIFAFLWECFRKHPTSAFVGFFLGYDFTHWLRSLPQERADMLLSKTGKAKRERKSSGRNKVPFPVLYGDWEFDLLGSKRFKLRPTMGGPWLYVCDAGPFFQSSFLTAIKPEAWPDNPMTSPEEWQTILEGKEERSTATLGPDMIRYNITENRVLGRLMGELNKGFVHAGVRLARNKWFGPGQAAQAWMALIGAPTADEIQQSVPVAALEFAQKTYFGGWFEIFAHGLIPGESYEYDINSAYPHIISRLPCLLHGEWSSGTVLEKGREEIAGTTLMVRASVSGPTRGNLPHIGAMLHRLPNGVICRPRTTHGWYWWHELTAAKSAGILTRIKVTEWMRYKHCNCPPPYAAIAELYLERVRIGSKTSAGKALKLLYNSAYGKMAQSIGSPVYSCSIYASLITAGCRTMILDAIATHPKGTADVLMVATDGVYFRSPHPTLDIDPSRLGAWEEGTKRNLSLFMPGVYWDDKAREKIARGEAPELRSRGIAARDLAESVANIDQAWNQWGIGKPLPTMSIPVRFSMVSATQALARNKWETCGAVTTDGVRQISSDPKNKRYGTMWDDTAGYNRSLPYDQPWLGDLESTPYDETFGLAEIDYDEDFNWETPDGPINGLLAEVLTR